VIAATDERIMARDVRNIEEMEYLAHRQYWVLRYRSATRVGVEHVHSLAV
jgi:hypothetical protein